MSTTQLQLAQQAHPEALATVMEAAGYRHGGNQWWAEVRGILLYRYATDNDAIVAAITWLTLGRGWCELRPSHIRPYDGYEEDNDTSHPGLLGSLLAEVEQWKDMQG